MKRNNVTCSPRQNKKIAELDRKVTSQYQGYIPEAKKTYIDTVQLPKSAQEIQDFFEQYIVARRPCKINGVPPQGSGFPPFPVKELKPKSIAGFLPPDEILTVETKVDGGFGSGAKRVKMTFGQFMDKLMEGKERGLYLTTQYYEDDPNASQDTDEEERDQVLSDGDTDGGDSITFHDLHDDFDELQEANQDEDEQEDELEYEMRLRELYQPPLTNLVETLPERPEFLKCLIPQQINLWIGSSSGAAGEDEEWLKNFDARDPRLGLGRNTPGGGVSSGLHHDHADNLYIPVAGRKRFTLFAPSDAAKMYTVGNIRHVYPSGVIDYVSDDRAPLWRHLRDDGAIVAEVYKFLLEKNEDESGGVLDAEQKTRYEKVIDLDRRKQEQDQTATPAGLDPPSFSTVPPAVVHLDKVRDVKLRESIARASESKWPLFHDANRIVAELKPGDMLYLPTGWFHEVTSFGDNDPDAGGVHVAVNYWFTPPTGNTLNNVYDRQDRYWPRDYEVTKRALECARTASE
ncbi:uncharacterized protein ZBIST_1560 [Zygosaccharomyces bailii]|nr:uncharacterized protein ZBIST_1560 [Zygosaccharomyces bailii]